VSVKLPSAATCSPGPISSGMASAKTAPVAAAVGPMTDTCASAVTVGSTSVGKGGGAAVGALQAASSQANPNKKEPARRRLAPVSAATRGRPLARSLDREGLLV